MSIRKELYRVIAFVLVTGSFTALVGMTMSNVRIQDSHTYSAVFSDVSGMVDHSPVKAAGVDVGSVKSMQLRPDNTVLVRFTVATDVQLSDTTNATVRYANLTGDRYLDLSEAGPHVTTAPLQPGATIPLARTAPALDLDALTNGFKPLLRGLSPDAINELSGSLIAVFQGQSGAVDSVLSHVASLTTDLASRDQLIGNLINNLNTVLRVADAHRAQFGSLIDQLQQLTTGLAADRHTIGTSLTGVDRLAVTTSGFLAKLRPELTGNVQQIGRLSTNLNKRTNVLDRYIRLLPDNLQLAGRASAYGSFFNLYLCGLRVKMTDAKGVAVYTPFYLADVPRCRMEPPRP